ncbi:glycoside hydrolase family 117 protein [Flavivirga algicola]|uniref:Family 43 glycosylhydrolase n=1 Tax=Flavivirga algicola TaxID=2729136 RepID=A0ABX1RSP9_9FLAO|nr:family 43 glycosylhydrolase [Flavivirga algicola]NMH86196.1 family 43 glycosylhydrolase [Flavivirga algicola]
MKRVPQLLFVCVYFILFACNDKKQEKVEKETVSTTADVIEVTDERQDFLGITNKDKLSAASKRALKWPKDLGNDWFFDYQVQDLKGDLAYEEGVVRRDPSAMIKENGKYYVWYTKSVGPTDGFAGDIEKDKVFPWDRCDIWYATSEDGWTWKEEGPAVLRGAKGEYDDRSVFTVEIMKHEDMYYLCYQTVKSPYNVRVKNQVGLAWSNSPDGPWEKSKEPILSPADNGVWKGEEQNRFAVEKKGDFDSHKVHDPCILPYKGKFYLYYKGEQMGEQVTFGGRQIRHGVAIADNPKGPYVKSPYNPISNSGHEICVWPYNGGIASLITTDGPEKNTVQWSPDGINFDIKAVVKGAPHAIGLNRSADSEEGPVDILKWGLTHQYRSYDYQYIRRFSTSQKKYHTAKGEKAK